MFVPVRPRPVVPKIKDKQNKMKKVLFIAVLVTLASCSSETSTSSKDSTCMDTTNIDSLIDSVDAHTDTLSALLKK
jgi:hypothetical protein